MNCPEAKEILWRDIAGELESEQAESLRGHLSLCPVCAKDYQFFKELSAHFSVAGVPSRPAGYWESYTAQVLERVQSGSVWEIFFSWKLAAAAAVLAIFVSMGIYHKVQQRHELNEIIADFEILENLEVLERKDFDEFIRKS